MRKAVNFAMKPVAVFWAAILLITCSSSISLFNQHAYELAVSLKIESLQLMDKATESYRQQEESVFKLKAKLDYAFEYAKGRPKNEISTKQWQILKDPERDLLGGFLKLWHEKDVVSAFYLTEKKKQIAEAFDTIIGLESGKINPDEIK